MKQKDHSRKLVWILLCILMVIMAYFPSVKKQLDFTVSSKQITPPIPQAEPTYLRWATSWGGSFADRAEDVWADQYYAYICGTLEENSTTPKMILSKYSEWGWGLQDWNVTWNNGFPTFGRAVWGDDSNIYTAGKNPSHLIIIKWDKDGNQIWNSTWNLEGNFGEVHAIWGLDNYVYICGVYVNDLLLIKWDSEGTQLWNRTWGGIEWEEGFDVWGVNNAIYTCGSTSSYGLGLNDSVIIKWDTEGNQLWNRTWGYITKEYYTSIFGFNSVLYVCGDIWNGNNTTTDIILMKWDENGSILWTRTWGGEEDERAYALWANEFYVFVSVSTLSWEIENEQVVLMKWNYLGIFVDSSWPTWENEYQYIPKSLFGYDEYLYICGWYNGSQEIYGNINQILFNFYSYSYPPAPKFFPPTPNPSLNGTFTLEWQYIVESESYNLYRDTHPILDITDRNPYQILTNTSYIETGMEEGTYFYIVTCVMKDFESAMSNPGVVEVILSNFMRKIPGYNLYLIIAILSFFSVIAYRQYFRKN